MRLWSISPQYLDTKGLVALWREALLARKVLEGNTKGYTNHPQLNMFKTLPLSVNALDSYLNFVYQEALIRDYKFSQDKLLNLPFEIKIPVTKGQIEFEFNHLLNKLQGRDREKYNLLKDLKEIQLHPIFLQVEGNVEDWEVL
jgi:hypothetical protein